MKLFKRHKNRLNLSTCPYCKNTDTQELSSKGGVLTGSKGQKCLKHENTTAISLENHYKGAKYQSFGCFCCGGFWHSSVFEKHWFWTLVETLKFYFGKFKQTFKKK